MKTKFNQSKNITDVNPAICFCPLAASRVVRVGGGGYAVLTLYKLYSSDIY